MDTLPNQHLSLELVERLRTAISEELGVELSLEEAQRYGLAWIRYLDLILSEQRKPPD